MSEGQAVGQGSRGLWSGLRKALPTLPADDRKALYEAMRGHARADVGVYVVVRLSSVMA